MFTVEQENRLRILKDVIDRAFRRLSAKGRRRGLPKNHVIRGLRGEKIDDIFNTISSMSRPPKYFDKLTDDHRMILEVLLSEGYTSELHRYRMESEILKDLYKNAAQYDLQSMMPRPKRTRRPSTPATRVERNAQNVFAKVKEWERKARLAKTKLAKYRAKAKRYEKKGVITNA